MLQTASKYCKMLQNAAKCSCILQKVEFSCESCNKVLQKAAVCCTMLQNAHIYKKIAKHIHKKVDSNFHNRKTKSLSNMEICNNPFQKSRYKRCNCVTNSDFCPWQKPFKKGDDEFANDKVLHHCFQYLTFCDSLYQSDLFWGCVMCKDNSQFS